MKAKLKQYAIVAAIVLLVMVGQIVLGVCVVSVKDYIAERKMQKATAEAVVDRDTLVVDEADPVSDETDVSAEDVPTDDVKSQEVEIPQVEITYEEPDIGMHDEMVPCSTYDFWKDVDGFKSNEESRSEVITEVNAYLVAAGYEPVEDCFVGNYSSLEAGTWGVDAEFADIELKLFIYYDGFNDEYTVSQWE